MEYGSKPVSAVPMIDQPLFQSGSTILIPTTD